MPQPIDFLDVPYSSDARPCAEFAGHVYVAGGAKRGPVESSDYGLWKTDGTAAGTTPVKVFLTGVDDPDPILDCISTGSDVVFVHGTSVYRTDGTEAGTQPVGNASAIPDEQVFDVGLVGTDVYVTSGVTKPNRLWVLRGTTFTEVAYVFTNEILPPFADVGGSAAFIVKAGSSIRVWSSDGTAAGTQQLLITGQDVTDVRAGVGLLWFALVSSPTGDPQLWRSDGTLAGTFASITSLDPIYIEPYPGGVLVVDTAGDLWRTDGTESDIELLASGVGPGVTDRAQSNGIIYLDDFTNELLWRTDLTPGGTFPLLATPNGGIGGELILFGPDSVSPTGLFFTQNELGSTGIELWHTDGQVAGTQIVTDLIPGSLGSSPDHLFFGLGKLFFSARDASLERELYTSDGTAAGTGFLADLAPGTPWISPQLLTEFGGELLFRSSEGLMLSDGTKAGTRVLPVPPPEMLSQLEFVASGSQIFAAIPRLGGTSTERDLWISDGTSAGTTLTFAQFAWGPVFLEAFAGDSVMFSADDGVAGVELWNVANAGLSGATLVADINPTTALIPNGIGRAYGSQYVFGAGAPGVGLELWNSDGTPGGTAKLLDTGAAPLQGNGAIDAIPVPGGVIVPSGNGTVGREPYFVDGTPGGTRLIADIFPGPSSGWNGVGGGIVVDGVLYMRADDGTTGGELWRTDGTTAGTWRVADIRPGPTGSLPDRFAALGSLVFFTADDGVHGEELWVSDGTEAGTQLVVDLLPGAGSSLPSNMTPFQGRIFFTANDGVTGDEMWSTDGTAAGTTQVADIWTGAESGLPNQRPQNDHTYYVLDEVLYFGANDGSTGLELWRLDADDADADGIPDYLESAAGCSGMDLDSDDDGLADATEDANQNGIVDPGETDPCNPDTDGDGIQDGTESGVTVGVADPDGPGPLLGTDPLVFIPDADPANNTDPLDPDSDDDGFTDGEEDPNANGAIEPGEGDPTPVPALGPLPSMVLATLLAAVAVWRLERGRRRAG